MRNKISITRYTLEDPTQLLGHPQNPKTHPGYQINALKQSLDKLGWVAPVIINENTGYCLDGHARILTAISDNTPEIPVLYVDLTEDEEMQMLLTFDRIGTLAKYDQDNVDDLISKLDLSDQPALADMVERLKTEPTKLIPAEPEINFDDIKGNQDRQAPNKTSIITCPNCDHSFEV